MVTMQFMVISLDEYFALVFLRWMRGDVQVVTHRVFAIIDDLARDAMKRTVVKVKAFFGQAAF